MQAATALTCISMSLWLLSLALVPFGDETPGIFVLFLTCTIGMIYPTVLPYGLLNYWYLVLVYRNFTGCSSRTEGGAFLGLFGLAVLYLLFDQYVMLGAYNMGELRAGSLAWMIALALVGIAPVVHGHKRRRTVTPDGA